jgi:hypothetical protein
MSLFTVKALGSFVCFKETRETDMSRYVALPSKLEGKKLADSFVNFVNFAWKGYGYKKCVRC